VNIKTLGTGAGDRGERGVEQRAVKNLKPPVSHSHGWLGPTARFIPLVLFLTNNGQILSQIALSRPGGLNRSGSYPATELTPDPDLRDAH
jgi:hypothetical protein